MRNLSLIILAILLLNFSCEEISPADDVQYISYGTSFGECYGYCNHEIIMDKDKAVFTKSGWTSDVQYPDSTCVKNFDTDPLPGYLEQFKMEEFMALDSVIGCPDCADGGSEWLEIGLNNDTKKIVFEYMNEPEALKMVIGELRNLTTSFKDCR